MVGKRRERFANRGQWNSRTLGHFDDGDAAQHLPRISALIALISPAFDEALGFVEVEGRDGDSAARSDFAYCEFGSHAG